MIALQLQSAVGVAFLLFGAEISTVSTAQRSSSGNFWDLGYGSFRGDNFTGELLLRSDHGFISGGYARYPYKTWKNSSSHRVL